MYKTLLACCLIVTVGCSQKSQYPHVVIDSSFGEIEVELYPDKAPKTVAAFLSCIDSNFYDGSSFYRATLFEGSSSISNAGILQGGIFLTNDKLQSAVPGIAHESTKQTGLSHTNGTISMARTTVGSANTEFFICIGDQTPLDYGETVTGDGQGFAAFGKVVKGMDVVRKIQEQPRNGERLTPVVKINKIEKN